jgi:hypothetical protein
LEDSKILYGDFKPAHHDDAMRKVNKQHLPEVVGYIKRNLLSDWQDISFVIGTNPEDFIELRFEADSVDSPAGLRTYLNNLVNSNEFVLKYQLRRVSQFWNLYSESGKQVYFMLAPPWVRVRTPILYLKQIQDMKDQQEIGIIDEQVQRGILSNDNSQGPRSWGGRGDGTLQMDEYGGDGDETDIVRGDILSSNQ